MAYIVSKIQITNRDENRDSQLSMTFIPGIPGQLVMVRATNNNDDEIKITVGKTDIDELIGWLNSVKNLQEQFPEK